MQLDYLLFIIIIVIEIGDANSNYNNALIAAF